MNRLKIILAVSAALLCLAHAQQTNWADAMSKAAPSPRQWTAGDTYGSIVMLDGTPKPTQAELEAAWQQVLTDRAAAATETASDNTETAQLRALVADLKSGAGTTAQRLQRVERVCAHLIKKTLP